MNYICSVNYHLNQEPDAAVHIWKSDDYGAVLQLGNVTLWPSLGQLAVIRDNIDAYLKENPIVAPFTPAEAEKIAAGIEAEDRAEALAQYGPEVAAGTLTEEQAVAMADEEQAIAPIQEEPWF